MRYLITTAMVVLTVVGCDVINPDEEQVAFIEVPEVTIVADNNQGGNTTDVRYIYAFVDGNNQGGVPMPASIPITGAGEKTIILSPAVRTNGQSSSSEIYPFYETIELQRSFDPLEVVDLPLELRYKDNTTIRLVADFEFSDLFTRDLDGDFATRVQLTDDESVEGLSSGLIELSTDNPVLQAATGPIIQNVPGNGSAVYIEIDYKNEVPFSIGLVGVQQSNEFPQEFLVFRESDVWRKAYVNLTSLVVQSGLDDFRIYLVAAQPSSRQEDSKIFIDNIKFLHFQ